MRNHKIHKIKMTSIIAKKIKIVEKVGK